MTNFRDSFRKPHEEGTPVELPSSGETVYLRSVDVQAVLFQNKLAEQLTNTALGALFTGKVNPDEHDKPIDWRELFEASSVQIEAICRTAFVQPEIVPDDTDADAMDEDQILYDWLDPVDREFVYRIMDKPVQEWRRFRSQSSEYVDSLREVAGGEQDAE